VEQKELSSPDPRQARAQYPENNPGDINSGETPKGFNKTYLGLGSPDIPIRYQRLGNPGHSFQAQGGHIGDLGAACQYPATGRHGSAGVKMHSPFTGERVAGFARFFNAIFSGGDFGRAGVPEPVALLRIVPLVHDSRGSIYCLPTSSLSKCQDAIEHSYLPSCFFLPQPSPARPSSINPNRQRILIPML